ncbi:MAG: type II secretion system GspH family protein [Heliobacteriaceae bacterium]|jgi:prepilin-type N-terminal cleavage/methylation domain-containing protein|nr:type II secretion system GspH family protein [Heliobacteriaceae bacterium]
MRKLNLCHSEPKGFTLAEVLITLGIIGVVAALTMPALIANYQKKVLAVQIKRAANIIQNGIKLYMVQEELSYLYDNNNRFNSASMNELHKNITKSGFKIAKDCSSDVSGCFAGSYKNIEKKNINDGRSAWKNCVALVSGESFCIFGTGVSQVLVDTNGKKGPNVFGRDLFTANIGPEGEFTSPWWNVACMEDDTECNELMNVTDTVKKCQKVMFLPVGPPEPSSCFELIQQNGWEMNY